MTNHDQKQLGKDYPKLAALKTRKKGLMRQLFPSPEAL
jgi:hypothetical protein